MSIANRMVEKGDQYCTILTFLTAPFNCLRQTTCELYSLVIQPQRTGIETTEIILYSKKLVSSPGQKTGLRTRIGIASRIAKIFQLMLWNKNLKDEMK